MIHILHVDDEESDALLLKHNLKKITHDVKIHWAKSALQALEILAKEEYDCILSDYQMPGMNGLEFLLSLNSREINIPFIFLTGQGNENIASEALRAGADDYYTKDQGIVHYERIFNSIVRNVEAVRERKEKESFQDELEASEEKFRIIFENKGTATGIVGEDGIIRQCNDALAELSGYSKFEMIDKMKWSDFVVKEDLKQMQTYFKQRFENEKETPRQYECSMQNKKGEVRTVVVNVAMLGKERIVSLLDITDRKRAEETLRESEVLLQATGELAQVGGWEFNPATNEVRWTEETYRIHDMPLDYKPTLEEAVNFFHPEDRIRLGVAFNKAVEIGEPYDMEFQFISAKGRQLYVRSICYPVIEHGKVIRLLGVVQDITERKQTEEALSESERRYRLIADNTTDSIWVMDQNLKFTYLSPSTERLFGYSLLEWQSLDWSKFVDPEYLDNVLAVFDQLKNEPGAGAQTAIVLVYHKDGGELFVEFNASPILDENDKFVSAIGVTRDITRRKRAEEALRISNERLKAFDRHSSEGVYRVDITKPVPINLERNAMLEWINKHAVIGDVNDALAHMYGLEPRDMIGKPATAFAPNYGERAVLILEQKDHQVADKETKDIDKDGNDIFLIENYHGIVEDGHLLAIWGAQRDITERKNVETKLEKAYEDLSAANKELESFSYSVSHDLKTPLRQLSMYSEILNENHSKNLDEEGRGIVAQMGNSGDRMLALIDSLLDLSRIQQKEIDRQEVDLKKIVKKVEEELREAEPDRTVSIEISSDLAASGDKGMLFSAIHNLLSNAWKFTQKTENARIEVGMKEIEGLQTFYVKDNGAGFDDTKVDRLFIPFQRLHAKKEFAGTGIGLATVKRIIQRHQGKIWAESEPGKGATFYFTLGN